MRAPDPETTDFHVAAYLKRYRSLHGISASARSSEVELKTLSWPALFAVLLAMFAIAVGYGVVLPILPFLIERLAGTADAATLSQHTGLLTGTYTLALFIFAPLWGSISDRHGRRPIILLGLIGFSTSFTLFALLESLPLLYFGRFLDGAFAAAVAPAAYALVGERAPTKEWRAYRFVLINVAATAGFFAGPMLGGLVFGTTRESFTEAIQAAFAAPFVATSGLALIAALLVWRFTPNRDAEGSRQITRAETQILRAVMVRLWAIAFVTAVAVGAFEVGLSLRGKNALGLDAAEIGMMFAECSLVMFAVQALVFSPLIKLQLTRWFLTPGLVLLALGLVLVPYATTYFMMTLTVALVAASAGILSPVVTYWVSLGAAETHGGDLGRVVAAASLGQAVGSAAGGLLFDVSILPNAGFILASVIVLAGLSGSLNLPQLLLRIRDSDGEKILGETKSASSPTTPQPRRSYEL
jgi:MFS family permease